MKVPFESILPDKNSSFRVLHHKVLASAFNWDYHYHPEIELVLVVNGTGRRHVGQHISYYDNGDLVLIGSNLPHAGFGYGAQQVHEEIVIQFKSEIFNNNIEFEDILTLLEHAKLGLVFDQKIKKQTSGLFFELIELSGIERYQHLLKILNILSESKIYEALNKDTLPAASLFKDQKRVSMIFDYVEKYHQENITSGHIADIINMTHPAFCNYFKATFSVTFTEFLNDFRIKKSIEFLNSGYNISETAFKAGFESLSYFSRLFKKAKGVSPSQYSKGRFEL